MNGFVIDDIDAFYSSEEYGEHMSQFLGATDGRIDPERSDVPISATMIREDGIQKHREYVPDKTNVMMVDRVAVVGGVSSGKTTLTSELAGVYDTEWMYEYGRDFWEQNADENGVLTKQQLFQLAKRHVDEEEIIARNANKYLFVDTTPLTTMAWSKYYHGSVPFDLQTLARQSGGRYDVHILCDPDIPFEEEPGRDGRQNRKRLHRMHIDLMERFGIEYHVVSGSVQERVETVTCILGE